MHVEPFTASVQYDDLKGTSAADRADNDAEKWLKEQGLSQEGEYLLGVEFYAGGGAFKDAAQTELHVQFYMAPMGDFDSLKKMIDSHDKPIVVRRIMKTMPASQFFSFFKRLSVTLSAGAMLEGREITFPDY